MSVKAVKSGGQLQFFLTGCWCGFGELIHEEPQGSTWHIVKSSKSITWHCRQRGLVLRSGRPPRPHVRVTRQVCSKHQHLGLPWVQRDSADVGRGLWLGTCEAPRQSYGIFFSLYSSHASLWIRLPVVSYRPKTLKGKFQK